VKERTYKLDIIKIRSLCSVKYTGKTRKRKGRDWKEIFPKTYLVKDCYPKYTLKPS
jgi:hypothetical protein